MLQQDLLFNRLRSGMEETGDWVVFIITKRGRNFVQAVFGDSTIERLDHGMEAAFFRPHNGEAFYRECHEHERLTTHYCGDYMAYYPALLNARQMVIIEQERLMGEAVSSYYTPLIDAAVAARDKREISRLFCEMPNLVVEKSFILDRLRNGDDGFPELREPGVNLSNWYKEAT